ncbi:MAG TPA: PepSY domain-containing protein [Methanobacterium sp.]|nr:PepSY domain-containing protein [Methanobacterium sp.]
MLNKSILAILALVIVAVIGAGLYAGSVQVKPASQSGNTDITTITSNNTSEVNNSQQNDSGKNMISASEAQNIAQTYIEEPGATAGTPRLVEIDGQMVYVVPVIMNSNTVGQIEIDAYTGKNVGGAGGVA